MLFLAFSLLSAAPIVAFAQYNGDWDYHGSGRDHPYSQYIDRATYVGYADYTLSAPPDYIDGQPYVVPIPAAPVAQQNEFVVNIPNKQGGYNAVVIKRSGSGFVGPQGEYYPEFPKVFQLELMYGK